MREKRGRRWHGVPEIPEDNMTECANCHVIMLRTVWSRSHWVEEAMGQYLDTTWRVPWIEIDASSSEDPTTAQSLWQLVHVVTKAVKFNNSKSLREEISIDPECIEKRRVSVITPNLANCAHPPIITMDEKQKGYNISYQANVNPAREGEAVNGDNQAEFHLKGVSGSLVFAPHDYLIKFL
jgi:hypothetical protein